MALTLDPMKAGDWNREANAIEPNHPIFKHIDRRVHNRRHNFSLRIPLMAPFDVPGSR